MDTKGCASSVGATLDSVVVSGDVYSGNLIMDDHSNLQ